MGGTWKRSLKTRLKWELSTEQMSMHNLANNPALPHCASLSVCNDAAFPQDMAWSDARESEL